jgi:predicted acyltransferase (DUF342 family)
MMMANGWCTQCNGTLKDVRSALKNLQGNTCKWNKGTGFANDYSITINTVAVSTVTVTGDVCAVTAPVKATDEAALTAAALKGTVFWNGVSIDAAATLTCTKASSGAAVIPSLAVLGLIVAAMA